MHRVMIVDDEPLVRQHLRTLLQGEESDFTVVSEAEDGKDAFKAFQTVQPDILITDIRMPDINGLELISKIKSSGYAAGFIVLSGYRDFAYTQQAMRQGIQNYLLKPVTKEDLLGALQSAAQELLRNRMLQRQLAKGIIACRERWLLSVLDSRNLDECQRSASGYGIELAGKEMVLFLAETEMAEGDDEENVSADFLAAMHSTDLVVAPIGFSRIACLWLNSGVEPAKKQAGRLKERLESFSMHVQIAYGTRVKALKEVRTCYLQAQKLLEARWLLGNGDILEYTRQQEECERTAWEALKQWNRSALDEAIEERNASAISQEVSAFFQVLGDIRHDLPLVRYIFVEDLLRSMRTVVNQGGDAYLIAGEQMDIDELLKQKTFDELRQWYAELCIHISEYLSKLKARQGKSVSQQIITMLKSDPQKTYTLQELAKIFYMNPAYLGQVFKKETGQTLHTYVTAYRVRKSKQDLMETLDLVYDIAERNGFQSLRHFYTAFKKMEGCTPSEYRERMK